MTNRKIVSSIHPDMDAGMALSRFVPTLALANVFSIVTAGLLDRLGKRFPRLTGNGVLMQGFEMEKPASPDYKAKEIKNTPERLTNFTSGRFSHSWKKILDQIENGEAPTPKLISFDEALKQGKP